MAIAEIAQDCLAAFNQLKAQGGTPCTVDEVEDIFGRFRLWVSNVSAHSSGTRSLLYRLRDNTRLSNSVENYLQDLGTLLQSAILENSLGSTMDATETSIGFQESDDDDDDAELFSEDVTSHTADGASALDEISEIIECLMRVSLALHNPASHDKIRYANDTKAHHFQQHDIEHVRAKFPHAASYLVDRLGKAISRHRHFLKYRELHHQKLAIDLQLGVTEIDEAPSTIATSLPGVQMMQRGLRQLDVEDESVYSVTSYATTQSGDRTLRPPPLPRAGLDGGPFECPLCYAVVAMPNERAWKQHVFEDIPPYVCTAEDCKTAVRQYSRRREWQSHLKSHRSQWSCPLGCSGRACSMLELERHLKSCHKQEIPPHELFALVKVSESTESANQNLQCPLCLMLKQTAKLLQKHIGRHLEQLALFALPQSLLSEDDGSDADTDTAGGDQSAPGEPVESMPYRATRVESINETELKLTEEAPEPALQEQVMTMTVEGHDIQTESLANKAANPMQHFHASVLQRLEQRHSQLAQGSWQASFSTRKRHKEIMQLTGVLREINTDLARCVAIAEEWERRVLRDSRDETEYMDRIAAKLQEIQARRQQQMQMQAQPQPHKQEDATVPLVEPVRSTQTQWQYDPDDVAVRKHNSEPVKSVPKDGRQPVAPRVVPDTQNPLSAVFGDRPETPRIYCNMCMAAPEGFLNEQELRQHWDIHHAIRAGDQISSESLQALGQDAEEHASRTPRNLSDPVSQARPTSAAKKGKSSYWTVAEQTDFVKWVAEFGTDFDTIGELMDNKTATMVRNHYHRQVNGGRTDIADSAARADERRALGSDRRELLARQPENTATTTTLNDNDTSDVRTAHSSHLAECWAGQPEYDGSHKEPPSEVGRLWPGLHSQRPQEAAQFKAAYAQALDAPRRTHDGSPFEHAFGQDVDAYRGHTLGRTHPFIVQSRQQMADHSTAHLAQSNIDEGRDMKQDAAFESVRQQGPMSYLPQVYVQSDDDNRNIRKRLEIQKMQREQMLGQLRLQKQIENASGREKSLYSPPYITTADDQQQSSAVASRRVAYVDPTTIAGPSPSVSPPSFLDHPFTTPTVVPGITNLQRPSERHLEHPLSDTSGGKGFPPGVQGRPDAVDLDTTTTDSSMALGHSAEGLNRGLKGDQAFHGEQNHSNTLHPPAGTPRVPQLEVVVQQRCHSCSRMESTAWRNGPDGAETLCNACGLHYAELQEAGRDEVAAP